jgi:hypothetical protein
MRHVQQNVIIVTGRIKWKNAVQHPTRVPLFLMHFYEINKFSKISSTLPGKGSAGISSFQKSPQPT